MKAPDKYDIRLIWCWMWYESCKYDDDDDDGDDGDDDQLTTRWQINDL